MRIIFDKLPCSVASFTAMPGFGFATPYQVAALFVVALCVYAEDKASCYRMIDLLKGPHKLSDMEKQFIRNRMMGKARYFGKSYFAGATPENNYTPDRPYTVVFAPNSAAFAEAGFAKVRICTCGAEQPRGVILRQQGNCWFLWEHAGLLSDIRRPGTAYTRTQSGAEQR